MVISIANQKGGCQKSTLNNELALFFQVNIKGAKVCLIDIDIQGSLIKQRNKDTNELKNDPKKAELFDKIYTSRKITPVDVVFSEVKNVKSLIEQKGKEGYNVFIIDFPGTIQVEELVEVYEFVNYLFIPLDCDDKSINATFEFISKVDKYILKKNNASSKLLGYSVFFTLFDNNEAKLTNQRFKALKSQLDNNNIDLLDNSFIKSDYWKNGTLGNTYFPAPNIKKYENMHPGVLLTEMIKKLK